MSATKSRVTAANRGHGPLLRPDAPVCHGNGARRAS